MIVLEFKKDLFYFFKNIKRIIKKLMNDNEYFIY